MAQIRRKAGEMARRRKLIKKTSVTKSNFETRIRKWQLPVCTISVCSQTLATTLLTDATVSETIRLGNADLC